MDFNELFPLQVFINLDKRTDRLELCKKEFEKIGISPIRKPGVIPEKIEDSWWRGAVGCMLSHFHILQAAYLLDTNVFIFEDDLKLDAPPVIIQNACMDLSERDWDMFYLGANILRPMTIVTQHLAKLSHAQSTVAYGINKKFLPKVLESIDFQNITCPIDVIYAEKLVPNCNAYIPIPMPIVQRDSYSDIEGREVNYTSYLQKRFFDNLK